MIEILGRLRAQLQPWVGHRTKGNSESLGTQREHGKDHRPHVDPEVQVKTWTRL